MKKFLVLILALIMLPLSFSCNSGNSGSSGNKPPESNVNDQRNLDAFEYSLMNLCGVDAAGRRVEPAFDRKDESTHTVGLFYSVWLGQHQHQQKDIYDITALLATQEGRDALDNMEENDLSRVGEFHFCSQPLYGYYNMADPWVVARHVELLTACGIDYLCIDATNNVVYQKPTFLLLDTLMKFQNQGFRVPKVMFYTNSYSGTTVTKIYNEFYQTEKYDSIWWSPNGKPMIIGITENNKKASDQTCYNPGFDYFITDACKQFFDVKESQWPNGNLNLEDGIPWMSWQYPQVVHTGTGSVSVSVAQHSPETIYMSDMHNHSSKGYDHATRTKHDDWTLGQNFQSEWNTVFENEKDIKNVMVTSWNEWMAIKQNYNGKHGFVDVYTDEYTRDCEMSAGKDGDNFYMQLVQNVRRYKLNAQTASFNYNKMTIDVDNQASLVQWDYVTAKYKDFAGEVMARDYENAAGTFNYTDNSNRNDVTDIRVVHNNNYLYFYVKTLYDVTEYNGEDENWMNVLISTGGDKSFAGYDFIINRAPKANGKTSVERSTGGYAWENAGEAEYRVYGNVMLYKIPLSALGLTADNCRIEFKVTDNITEPGNILNYYVSGESAPLGRLSFSYGK
ncbi:MAG: hypothetical protein IJV67_03175 [Clostridia bacterium]|nr:hypothetical protein [Clostridia bacterium]